MSINFKFPITKSDGSEFKSAKELLNQLNGETAGFYLLSAHGFWHGGLHISDATTAYAADKHPVRCMADGEVVAYRLNDDYATSTWGEGAAAATLNYSTSFCLVRHRYESPHKKPPAAPAGAGTATPANSTAPASTPTTSAQPAAPATANDQGPQNKLVFYTLYMHLLPYAGYAQRVFIEGGASAYDQFPGVGGFVPAASSSSAVPPLSPVTSGSTQTPVDYLHATPLSLPAGTEVIVLDEQMAPLGESSTLSRMLYVKVSALPAAGTPPLSAAAPSVSSAKVGQHYWIPTQGVTFKTSNNQPIVIPPTYWKTSRKATGALKKTVNARRAPNGEHVGTPIHTLPAGSTVEIQSERSLKLGTRKQPFAEAKILTLGQGDAGSVAVGDTVWISGDKEFLARDRVIPDDFDTVVIRNPAFPIKAGDPVGYLGLYETPGEGTSGKTSRKQVHIELFTGDDQFADFFSNKAGLTEGKKFKVAGTDVAPAAQSGTSFTPGTDKLILPVVVDVTPALAKEDAQHKKWFPVEGIGDNGVLGGWVAESQLKDVLQYKWEDLGFRKVEETNDNADGYMDPDKVPDFFKKIYHIIDRNTDNDITPEELLAANQNTVVRDALAHVVAKHPSEWQGKSGDAKWNVLKEKDALLKNDLKRLKHEQERIDKLTWWDDVKGVTDFPSSPNAWHFNPIKFLEAIKSDFRFTLDMMQHLFPSANETTLQAVVDELNAHIELYKLDKPLRRAHFFAQVKQEVGESFSYHDESLNYASTALAGLFSYFAHHPQDSLLYGRTNSHPADQEAIANHAYAGQDHNGDIASGDGYLYRGRGMIQLTHRGGYRRFTDWNRANGAQWPQEASLDFEANPELVSQIKYAVRSAAYFWVTNNLYTNADSGDTQSVVDSITRKINSGLFSLPTSVQKQNAINGRRNNFQAINTWGGFDE